jgi:hypothetical protein
MSATALLVLHELLCGVLLWTCFCRATRTNSQTQFPVLGAFYLLSVSALTATFAPLVMGWEPDAVSLLLLASIALVQTVTARFWQMSPPAAFQRPIDSDFLDSDNWSDRTPLEARCPTTQPTDWGKP